MIWFHLTRRTGESGASDAATEPVWVSSDSIQFLQRTPSATRIYLRAGALEAIDVIEELDEILSKGQKFD